MSAIVDFDEFTGGGGNTPPPGGSPSSSPPSSGGGGKFLAPALFLAGNPIVAAAAAVWSFIDSIGCRLHSGCAPKLRAAVSQIGYAGYRLGTQSQWNYYLPNGINLTWDLSKFYNAQVWYAGGGYFEKLKNTGIDHCCLKSKWPPAEAFPLSGAMRQHIIVRLPDGKTFEADPQVFDMNTYQKELDAAAAAGAGRVAETQGGVAMAGIAPLAALIGLFALSKGK